MLTKISNILFVTRDIHKGDFLSLSLNFSCSLRLLPSHTLTRAQTKIANRFFVLVSNDFVEKLFSWAHHIIMKNLVTQNH